MSDPGWIRLYYRNGKSEVFRPGPKLDRARQRRVPIVIHEEPALIHRCQHCSAEGPWGPSWRAYPVLKHHPEHIQQRAGAAEEYIVCGPLCWDAMLEGLKFPHWMDPNREPSRPREMMRALWEAGSADRIAQAEAKDYRKVPLANEYDNGRCKWCNEPMTEADKPSRMWHRRCARQWELHALLPAQLRFLRKRDGPTCAMPGCDRRGCEVDHRRPLWSVRHLPPMIRRVFYGPRNLWLLCTECHAAKTKHEAAERARKRAEER